MIAGDSRNAECPHAPDSSSSTHEMPADAVPYIGSLRASDWSLHGGRLAASVIRWLEPAGTTTASRSSRRISTVASARSRPGSEAGIGDQPAVKCLDRRRTRRRKGDGRSGRRSTTRRHPWSMVATSPRRHRTADGVGALGGLQRGQRPDRRRVGSVRRDVCVSGAAAPPLSCGRVVAQGVDHFGHRPWSPSRPSRPWSVGSMPIGSDFRKSSTVARWSTTARTTSRRRDGGDADGQVDRRGVQRLARSASSRAAGTARHRATARRR